MSKGSKLTEKGAMLLRQIGVLPAGLSRQELKDFLQAYEPKCPVDGCGKAIKSVLQVARLSKYGARYEYLRLRHRDARKKDHRSYCYISVERTEA